MLIRDGAVVWEDDHITFVGKTYDGPVDRALQASERPSSWDGRTAAETFPKAFPWVEGPL